ncbi:MAG: hypothetical protein CME68_04225 [Halobacteriovoraceae bacterium]|nr:hypothetical protein [Halobacteriovoraceae bacterium]
MLKGISFDFWDTLFIDDSDEKKRVDLGLCSKAEERFHLLKTHLSLKESLSSSLKSAINYEKEWFESEWKSFNRTPSVEKRIKKICESLKVDPRRDSILELASKFENLEVEIQPDPFEDCFNILKELSKEYKLAITSDTIYTPGQGIRKILKDHGMFDLFHCFSFSNEVGVSKPKKEIFFNTLENLELAPKEVVHVGDRFYNDVFGGQRSGLSTVWLNLKGHTQGEEVQEVKADFEIRSLSELPRVLKKL